MSEVNEIIEKYVPYQLCPKCNGQGIVSKPSWVAGDVNIWTSTSAVHVCDICSGAKIIPMCPVETKNESRNAPNALDVSVVFNAPYTYTGIMPNS